MIVSLIRRCALKVTQGDSLRSILLLGFIGSLLSGQVEADDVARQVDLETLPGKIRVTLDGKIFTELCYEGWRKPILYPIVGPHETELTRNFPMVPGVAGEQEDHPHHQSLWFAHGAVNGHDFWSQEEGAGKIVCDGTPTTNVTDHEATIEFTNRWVTESGDPVCSDRTVLRFSAPPSARQIDWEITLVADQGDVRFGDTKEGTMAIRLRREFHLVDPSRGIESADGYAINSEGTEGAAIWGQRAAWVYYQAEVEGKTIGFSMIDYPRNLRHPTWWHARSYGLVAANPFGIFDFEGGAPHAGTFVLPQGESLTLRYRFLFHDGQATPETIANLCRDLTGNEPSPE